MGPVIAMTANGRLDYFGRTVNVAARLGDQSRGHDVVLLRGVFDQVSGRIASERTSLTVQQLTVQLRGLESAHQVVPVAVGPVHDPERGEPPVRPPSAHR